MIPEGYKLEQSILYGMRKSHPGLLEVVICNPKQRNAIGTPAEQKMLEIFTKASEDPNVKVILFHGGQFFTSGIDLSMFSRIKPDDMAKEAEKGVLGVLTSMLMAMATCKKPIVAVVRGAAVGIGFTLLNHCHFVYCTPETKFMTPFMKTNQSPEGTSTLIFP